MTLPPLALYVHIPWCLRKCPYCDFNAHALTGQPPEAAYLEALLKDLDTHRLQVASRPVHSIFFGGGTPSLLSAHFYRQLLDGIKKRVNLLSNAEITLEANPGTFEQQRFCHYRQTGINRLSIGIQSFHANHLNMLGRIHSAQEALQAIQLARQAGFTNINLDLMFGLPHQSVREALDDLQIAIEQQPTHLSWYQLSMEPNSIFFSTRPPLPDDEIIWSMHQGGLALLQEKGFRQYEISAWSQPGQEAKHNLNYWQFGDFIGIGAGAHSKLTSLNPFRVVRFWKTRAPKDYLKRLDHFRAGSRSLSTKELPLEFMMNALRLNRGTAPSLFTRRTGLPLEAIASQIQSAVDKGLMEPGNRLQTSPQGRLFLNELLESFMR
jgi:oxygen-independent coproporphyrinogen-3 oxidase